MSDKLTIKSETAALDRKDRAFYDNLTEEERKKLFDTGYKSANDFLLANSNNSTTIYKGMRRRSVS